MKPNEAAFEEDTGQRYLVQHPAGSITQLVEALSEHTSRIMTALQKFPAVVVDEAHSSRRAKQPRIYA